jgi:hypothetical protein
MRAFVMPLAQRRRLGLIAVLACTVIAGACGHVPLSSLPKLSKIDFKTTKLAELRAGISVPADIRSMPGGVAMTVTVEPREGGRHERSFALEEVKDPVELASLPVVVSPGRRFTVFRLSPSDATKFTAFREEYILRADGGSNRGSIALDAHKACRIGELTGRPIPMTSYLKTSETQDYVMLTRDLDLRDAAREVDPKIDLATAIPPCSALDARPLDARAFDTKPVSAARAAP